MISFLTRIKHCYRLYILNYLYTAIFFIRKRSPGSGSSHCADAVRHLVDRGTGPAQRRIYG